MEIPQLMIDIGYDTIGMLFGSANAYNPDKDIPSLEGKVIIVTGGNNGLGKETITRLAKHSPAAIYLCSRDVSRGETAIKEVKATIPEAPVKLLQLDLASFESVASAAKTFTSQSDRLDILVNNAGIMGVDGTTKEGYELQMGTNHLGPALFTKLLLPTMLKTAEQTDSDVRIVTLSSGAHMRAPAPGFDANDALLSSAGSMGRYGRSKLANVLYAKKLAAMHPQIKSVALHPGVIKTDLFNPVMQSNRVLGALSSTFGFLVYKTVEEGAKNTLWAATAPKDKVESGAYYTPVGVMDKGSSFAQDSELQEQLWQWTEDELKKHNY